MHHVESKTILSYSNLMGCSDFDSLLLRVYKVLNVLKRFQKCFKVNSRKFPGPLKQNLIGV